MTRQLLLPCVEALKDALVRQPSHIVVTARQTQAIFKAIGFNVAVEENVESKPGLPELPESKR